jgi:hypothetical protein
VIHAILRRAKKPEETGGPNHDIGCPTSNNLRSRVCELTFAEASKS